MLIRPTALGMGVRVTFVAVAIGCYFATLAALAFAPALEQSGTWSALEWLVGVIGVAVAGDTIRPSGQTGAAFSVAPSSTTTITATQTSPLSPDAPTAAT